MATNASFSVANKIELDDVYNAKEEITKISEEALKNQQSE